LAGDHIQTNAKNIVVSLKNSEDGRPDADVPDLRGNRPKFQVAFFDGWILCP
jgi:hypothetical protein